MSPALRRVLAVVVACVAAVVIVRLLEHLARQVTMPPGLDPTNPEQVETALEHGEFPFASLALVLCGWLLAAYAGSRIAIGIARDRFASLIFAVIFTALTIHDLAALQHPTWMWIGGALGVPLVALGAVGESITFRGL